MITSLVDYSILIYVTQWGCFVIPFALLKSLGYAQQAFDNSLGYGVLD